MGLFEDIELALMIAALIFSIASLANISEYGYKNWRHFFYKYGPMYKREYYNDRGWVCRKVSLFLLGLSALLFLLYFAFQILSGVR